jgi:putative transposase
VGRLRRKRRADAGRERVMSAAVRQAVAHKSWSARLHHDNLVALCETRPELRLVPSYSTLRRFLKGHDLRKRRRVTSRETPGAERAEARRTSGRCAATRPNMWARSCIGTVT